MSDFPKIIARAYLNNRFRDESSGFRAKILKNEKEYQSVILRRVLKNLQPKS